jgi:hypothetical protein
VAQRLALAIVRGLDADAPRHLTRSVILRPASATPVDTVGAGDGFDAGFLAGWLASGDLADALAWGCACGALSTRAVGGTAGQPIAAEARSLAAQIQVTGGRPDELFDRRVLRAHSDLDLAPGLERRHST